MGPPQLETSLSLTNVFVESNADHTLVKIGPRTSTVALIRAALVLQFQFVAVNASTLFDLANIAVVPAIVPRVIGTLPATMLVMSCVYVAPTTTLVPSVFCNASALKGRVNASTTVLVYATVAPTLTAFRKTMHPDPRSPTVVTVVIFSVVNVPSLIL
jgi:hypothetical protein